MQQITRSNRVIPFAQISHTVLNDQSLSWRAKGLFAYLASKPDAWRFQVKDLIKRSTDGRDAVRVAIKELEAHGYLKRVPNYNEETKRLEGYTWQYDQEGQIHQDDQLPGGRESRRTEKQADGNPGGLDFRRLSNKEDSNKEESKKEGMDTNSAHAQENTTLKAETKKQVSGAAAKTTDVARSEILPERPLRRPWLGNTPSTGSNIPPDQKTSPTEPENGSMPYTLPQNQIELLMKETGATEKQARNAMVKCLAHYHGKGEYIASRYSIVLSWLITDLEKQGNKRSDTNDQSQADNDPYTNLPRL